MTAPLVAILVPRIRLGLALTVRVRDLPGGEYRCGAPRVMATHTRAMNDASHFIL